MSNLITTQIDKLAATLMLPTTDGAELYNVLKSTAFKSDKDPTDAQLSALLIVANQYGLNPWTKEIYAFPDRGGIVPVVGVDGWSRIINSNPQFDGIDFQQDAESCACIIYRKDRAHPVRVTEYLDECIRPTMAPWKSHPRRMLRHKALIQCARLAFGYAGIYDPDEAERIIEAAPKDMGTIDAATGEIIGKKPEAKPPYAQADFDKNLPAWHAAIAAGKSDADRIIGKLKSIATITPDQEKAIRALAPVKTEAHEAKPVDPAAKLRACKTEDALNEAMGAILEPTPELNAVYDEVLAGLRA